jgi:hypothetical protein
MGYCIRHVMILASDFIASADAKREPNTVYQIFGSVRWFQTLFRRPDELNRDSVPKAIAQFRDFEL